MTPDQMDLFYTWRNAASNVRQALEWGASDKMVEAVTKRSNAAADAFLATCSDDELRTLAGRKV